MVTFSLLTEVLRPLLLTLLLPHLLCGVQALWLSPPGWFCLLYLLPGMSASQALLTLGFWTIRSSETDTCHGSCEDGPSRIHVKRPWPLPSGFLGGAFAGELLSCASAPLSSPPSSLICFLFFYLRLSPFLFSKSAVLQSPHWPHSQCALPCSLEGLVGSLYLQGHKSKSPFKYQEVHCPWLLVSYGKSV